MNQMIAIIPHNIGGRETNSVNARALHEALGIKKDFSDWIKPKLKDAMLDEGVDFLTIPLKGVGGKFDSIEYILTLDTAKHIAMMSRTPKGKEVRAYFIEVEKMSVAVKPSGGMELALAKSLEMMAEGITVLASSMKGMEQRITALETAPTPVQRHINPTSQTLGRIRELVALNPGINQSQLLTLAGIRRDDKGTLKLLRDLQGVLWETGMYSNQVLYYPILQN